MVRGLLLILLAAVLAATGCSSSGSKPTASPSASSTPVLVGSGQFAGKRTQTVDLGAHKLGASTWVAWELDGAANARASFKLALRDDSGAVVHAASMGPVSFSGPVVNDRAMFLNGTSGTGTVSFSQIVRSGRAHGYGVKFKVFTSP